MTRMRTLWLFSKLRMKYWHKKEGKQNRKRKQEGAALKIEIRCVIKFLNDFSLWNMRGLGGVEKWKMVKKFKSKNNVNILGLIETKKEVISEFDVV
ncbi:hypothetical protein AHAS_Ahas15G0315900 [Arachis hypogaea]